MDYLFDIIMVAILALSIFFGYKKGLLMTVLSLVSVVVAVIAAQLLSPYINSALTKSGLDERLSGAISTKIEALYEQHDERPDRLSCADLVKEMELPEAVSEFLEKRVENYGESADFRERVQTVGREIASLTLHLISYAVIALAAGVVLLVISLFIQAARKLPVVGRFDNAGGAILGAVRGVLIVLVVCVAIYAASILASSSYAGGIMAHSLVFRLVEHLGILSVIL